MCLTVVLDREEDGRWIAEVPQLPGVLVYAQTEDAAVTKAKALSLRVLADRLEHGEALPPRMLARIARHTGLEPDDL
jgi:predicted RNase H-like HicB family nuclease